jgi:peptide/nickel transport system ATP-binding protein
MNDRRAALKVSDLTVVLESGQPVVEHVDLELAPGETLGLVGESGSGKTTTGYALLGFARPGMRIASGDVEIGGDAIALHSEKAARKLRGRVVSHVPQDPATSLNPSLRIAAALADMRAGGSAGESSSWVADSLARVQLPATREFGRRFPHELSGGQQQRVLIACALANEPPLLVLDEPTTGLDVVTQARILDEIARLRDEREVAMVYVSHDLAVVAQVADKIAVMYAGIVVELGPTSELLSRPRHPYTRGLVASIPDHRVRKLVRGIPGVAVGLSNRPPGCPFSPRCPQVVPECTAAVPELVSDGARSVRCIRADQTPALSSLESAAGPQVGDSAPLLSIEHLRVVHHGRGTTVVAADDISFQVRVGECVALVGESGSGKTTIARAIAGLHPPESGRILLRGEELAGVSRRRSPQQHRLCQMVFQNPYESLNPRRRVIDEVARTARLLRGMSSPQARVEAGRLLERVRLPAGIGRRFPTELSGGERQRIAIARALAAAPSLLICDEITSALDVSVQAAVIELLTDLRRDLAVSLIFITHSLPVVASIADRVLILHDGQIREEGSVEQVFQAPQHERTRQLLEAAPAMSDLVEMNNGSAQQLPASSH